MASKNQKLLLDFSVYCAQHPQERFWQALKNWSNHSHIYIQNPDCPWKPREGVIDTFYFEGKNK